MPRPVRRGTEDLTQRTFADDQYHEELLTAHFVMPRAPQRNVGTAPYVAANTYAWDTRRH